VLLKLSRAQNIEDSGRRRRLLIGAGVLAVALAGLAGLVASGAGREFRLLLFIPFWIAALCVTQSATGT
jgi:hypothetical protein